MYVCKQCVHIGSLLIGIRWVGRGPGGVGGVGRQVHLFDPRRLIVGRHRRISRYSGTTKEETMKNSFLRDEIATS